MLDSWEAASRDACKYYKDIEVSLSFCSLTSGENYLRTLKVVSQGMAEAFGASMLVMSRHCRAERARGEVVGRHQLG